MRIFLTLIMCVLLFPSCQESRKEAMLRLVSEWKEKEVKFPEHSVFTVQGKDTVDFEFRHADYKVVTYIDSVGCTSCKLQLPRWKELLAEVDSLMEGSVPFLFYFHPKDMKELRYLTRRDRFTYPVCFDEKDEFNETDKEISSASINIRNQMDGLLEGLTNDDTKTNGDDLEDDFE